MYGSLAERSSLSDSRESCGQQLDRVGEVDRIDRVVAALDPELVGLEQNLSVGEAVRRLEAVGGELDQQAERLAEVDRVHEAAVLDAGVMDAALVEALDRLAEGRVRDVEGDVVNAARVGRRRAMSRTRGPRW